MFNKRKDKNVPFSDLRSRLEEYSSSKEKNRWAFEEEDNNSTDSFFNFFPISFLRDMHSLMLFKITLAFLTLLIVFLISFIQTPFTVSMIDKVHYITTWKMDFMEIGRETVPVIRKLWEGNLETDLDQVVLAPGGNVPAVGEVKLIAPLQGELEETFGFKFNPGLQKEEMFYGLVFTAPGGTEVNASAAGLVKKVGEHPYYGLYLLVEHPAGMETCYGYLMEVLVEEGDKVNQGQRIARIGSDPQGIKAALYFELREKGQPIDPLPLLVD
ncbi:MAG: M23 family metallopeptidase [Bacillota bacterium]|nr:M23 family metallopeptidase [Bacillota bacterium]